MNCHTVLRGFKFHLILTAVVISLFGNTSGTYQSALTIFDESADMKNDTKPCKAFFNVYVEVAGNFTHCELINAKPFRFCTKCFEPFAIMKALYKDLTTDPNLHDCMVTYLKSDRVQVIPTIQKNAESLWETSDCDSCVRHLHVDEKTEKVEYTVPEDTEKFLDLFHNTSDCLSVDTLFDIDSLTPFSKDDNMSVLCHLCNEIYHRLNSHYDSMADSTEGNVCMDIVDMMNYTRVAWSEKLNCSHRTASALTVVVITLVIAVSPLLFYLPLRYTSHETILKVLKQKRLGPNRCVTSSTTQSFAAGDSQGRQNTPLPRVVS